MFHIVLFEPEIPPNTGNIIRLCANTGAQLHLIEPMGFQLDNTRLKRAGLDYHEWASVQVHGSLQVFMESVPYKRLFAFSTKGRRLFTQPKYDENDAFLFGPETRGLPDEVLANFDQDSLLTLPMRADQRSLNLSNSVAIVNYEAWRQQGFVGAVMD